MNKIIWMSDPHFVHEGLVQSHDPRLRLDAAIDHLNTHHNDAAYCIISGDMVNRGKQEDYSTLNQHLSRSKVKILPMVGNHDDRALFRSNLSVPDSCMDGFIQYSVSTSDMLILCLDTHKIGSDAGEFCSVRKNWVEEKLRSAGDKPVYIFMHHPPMELGLPMQDQDKMENGADFLKVLTKHKCVKHLFIGHVHRPITGTVQGIPFATMRSILYQAPPAKPEWDWSTFSPAREAPNYGVLHLTKGSVNLQYVQFCDFEYGLRKSS